MCLILFAYQTDPRLPLVVAANRDELFARPTTQAALWVDEASGAQLLSGRDQLAGGTWLGITEGGRFAAVTNIRDPSQTERRPRSRGELTCRFLASSVSAESYATNLSQSYDQYAGYNLLVGDGEALYYVNNQQRKVWSLEPGIYGLSNGLLNTAWPKVETGKERLTALLTTPEQLSTDALLAMMGDRAPASDVDLPDTGIGIEIERKLSSAFILNPERDYGTLCSTAVICDAGGGTRFAEQNFDSLGNKTQGHAFNLPPA